MLTRLIETVYRLLWGDLFVLPVGGGSGDLPDGDPASVRGAVLHPAHPPAAGAAVPGYALGSLRKEPEQRQPVLLPDADRLHRHPCGNGQSGGRCGGGVGRRGRCPVLDVGHGPAGASTSFVESTLAQKYKQPDPLYGGQQGGPACYLHALAERKQGRKLRRSVLAVLFAVSGLICWCGISQVVSNSVSAAFENAFAVPPVATTVILVVLSAVIVLRRNATVKSLDVIVPIMAGCYFLMTLYIILTNLGQLPAVLGRIFAEAFGFRQAAAGGFGAVLMNGIKRGLFSNEAGSGSAPAPLPRPPATTRSRWASCRRWASSSTPW